MQAATLSRESSRADERGTTDGVSGNETRQPPPADKPITWDGLLGTGPVRWACHRRDLSTPLLGPVSERLRLAGFAWDGS